MSLLVKVFVVLFAVALVVSAIGCHSLATVVTMDDGKKDYYRALPPGQHALRKITDPAMLPDFTRALASVDAVRDATKRSLNYIRKASAKQFFPVSGISREQVEVSLVAFMELLDSGKSAAALNTELRDRFDVYISVGCDDQGTVLFTGYYTPIFDASKTRTERFRYPLHKLPANHVKDAITGETLGRKRSDGTVDKNYPERAALLASGELDGNELVWLSDPFEAYVAGVQGSAILRLTDGKRIEVGYAGNNGHEYTSLGAELIKSGKMRREQINLRSLITYFQDHPDEFTPLANRNKRYVFFQETTGGPFGSLNERVTALRSIATDKSIFPRAALCFLDTRLPIGGRQEGYQGFALDQDAGGAIRAPGRCDVFMGTGDEAGDIAGRTLAEGKLYYLIFKDAPSARISR